MPPAAIMRVMRRALPPLLALLLPAVGAAYAEAEVVRLEIARREVVLNGQPFGNAGPYEKLVGTVHFALDPSLPANRGIIDLWLAPKNTRGVVEFSVSDGTIVAIHVTGDATRIEQLDIVTLDV